LPETIAFEGQRFDALAVRGWRDAASGRSRSAPGLGQSRDQVSRPRPRLPPD